jgi:predicted dehydrogenase
VVNLQRHWVDCLRTGKTPENNGEENLLTVQLVEGAYISVETQTIYRS